MVQGKIAETRAWENPDYKKKKGLAILLKLEKKGTRS